MTAPATVSGRPAESRLLALAGNPNCGKTTLFNALTGLRHRVGNYAGVTVERREGRLRNSDITVLDLPGAYSLGARSPDEEIARDVLLGYFPPLPQMVLVVVDASNLERNLYLVSQVMDLGIPVILCLNMMDVAASAGLQIDVDGLQRELGIPVVPCVASRGEGLARLVELAGAELPPPPTRRWKLPEREERAATTLASTLQSDGSSEARTALFKALTLLCEDNADERLLKGLTPQALAAVRTSRTELGESLSEIDSVVIESRYAWIQDVCDRVCRQGEIPITWSDRIDRVATHRIGGFLVFFALMALMFQAIFTWAQTPAGWIETGQGWLGEFATARLPDGDLKSLVVDGVIAGVGGVIVFMPQILFFFFFIGLLEDSGYMARAAFVMDRVMSRVGLHGKSFIPLLSSFACAIPGILATRTIEERRDRMVTILVAPLMSCSARLPVYTVLIAGFIPQERVLGVFSLPGLVLVSMYLLGLVAALGMASVFKKFVFKGDTPLFLMELPPYKLPSVKTVALQTWERSSEFLQRAGTVILAINILLWATMRFPGDATQHSSERLRNSIAGHAGRILEPVIQPFGMDWKVAIGILGSFAAREVFVSTMATVYNVEEDDEDKQSVSVRVQMQSEKDPNTGAPRFTALSAVALMVFYVLALQCASTVATVRRETGSWRWAAFQWVYMFVLAWCAATGVYQLGRAVGLS